MANQGKRMVPEYLIKKIGEGGGGTEYTAGTGIDISANNEISVDTETVAMKSDLATVATTGDYDDLTNKPTIPDAVSGTNDGTNWTSITIGETTKAIPQGGGSSYTAGNGINITNNAIAIDPTVVARLNSSNTFAGSSNNVIKTNGGTGAASTPFTPIVEILANKGYSSNVKSTLKMGSNTSSGTVYPGTIEAYSDGTFNIINNEIGGKIKITKTINNSLNSRDIFISESVMKFQNNGNTVTVPEATGTIALTSDITNVSGTNDGTNWTSLTVGSDTYNIPAGGGGGSSVIKISYPKYPGDVLEELQVTDPSATIEQAVLKWIQDMPVFVYASASQGKSALETAGFTNVIEINETGKVGYGDYEIEGPFAVRPLTSSGGAGNDTNIHIYAGLTNSASQTAKFAQSSITYELKVNAKSYFIVKNKLSSENAAQYATEFASATTAITTASQGLILNGFTLTYLSGTVPVEGTNTYIMTHITGSRYNAVNGVRNISAPLSVYLPGETTLQSTITNQLAAPTTAGTYKLQCTVDASGKQTFAWVLDN